MNVEKICRELTVEQHRVIIRKMKEAVRENGWTWQVRFYPSQDWERFQVYDPTIKKDVMDILLTAFAVVTGIEGIRFN